MSDSGVLGHMVLAKDMPQKWMRTIYLDLFEVIILHSELQMLEHGPQVPSSINKFFQPGYVVVVIEGVDVIALWDVDNEIKISRII